jgi:hypothetical protein
MSAAMTTAFLEAGELHASHVIHQKGLTSIRAVALCTIEGNAGAGIYNVPSWAFDGRAKYAGEIAVCQKCARTMKTLANPPK